LSRKNFIFTPKSPCWSNYFRSYGNFSVAFTHQAGIVFSGSGDAGLQKLATTAC